MAGYREYRGAYVAAQALTSPHHCSFLRKVRGSKVMQCVAQVQLTNDIMQQPVKAHSSKRGGQHCPDNLCVKQIFCHLRSKRVFRLEQTAAVMPHCMSSTQCLQWQESARSPSVEAALVVCSSSSSSSKCQSRRPLRCGCTVLPPPASLDLPSEIGVCWEVSEV